MATLKIVSIHFECGLVLTVLGFCVWACVCSYAWKMKLLVRISVMTSSLCPVAVVSCWLSNATTSENCMNRTSVLRYINWTQWSKNSIIIPTTNITNLGYTSELIAFDFLFLRSGLTVTKSSKAWVITSYHQWKYNERKVVTGFAVILSFALLTEIDVSFVTSFETLGPAPMARQGCNK